MQNHKLISEIIELYSTETIENIKPESRFVVELGMDSIDMDSMVFDLEEAFDIEIPDSEFQELNTVSDLINYIEFKTNKTIDKLDEFLEFINQFSELEEFTVKQLKSIIQNIKEKI